MPTTCQALTHMLLGQLPTHYSSPPHEAGTDLQVRSWSALPVLPPGGTAERWGTGIWTQALTSEMRELLNGRSDHNLLAGSGRGPSHPSIRPHCNVSFLVWGTCAVQVMSATDPIRNLIIWALVERAIHLLCALVLSTLYSAPCFLFILITI